MTESARRGHTAEGVAWLSFLSWDRSIVSPCWGLVMERQKFTIVTASLIAVTRGVVCRVVQLAQGVAGVERNHGASFDIYQASTIQSRLVWAHLTLAK